MDDIDALAARLIAAREAYYLDGEPEMSDAKFDALEDRLRQAAPNHPYFSTVGVAAREGAKISHRIPMLSMGKVKSLEELDKWLTRLALPEETPFCLQPKIDGLSATALYRNGRLQYFATRGDGAVGQDVSHIARYMTDIPMEIPFSRETLEIRGELHLPKSTPYDTGGKPLRNNTVGLVNRKEDRDDLHHVKLLAYQIVRKRPRSSGDTAEDGVPASESGKIDLLAASGFDTVPHWKVTTLDEMRAINEEYVDRLRDEWDFETDGLVLTVDDDRLFDEIDERWVVDHHHHYAVAFKPPAESAVTPLKGVEWQVSRRGVLTPVALFEPVVLGGATLERASLHNAQNVRRLALRRGDGIVVERANDVIPYVRANPDATDRTDGAEPSLLPETCPSCGSIPVEEGVNLRCVRPDCRDKVLQGILYWVRQAGIEQVALRTLESLYDAGKLRSVRDLYTLTAEDFAGLEGFGEKKIDNFLDQVSAAKSLAATDLIARLGIPLVQKKSLSRLGIRTLEDFRRFDDDSYVIGRNIIKWKNEPGNTEFLDELLEVVELRDPGDTGSRGTLCLTGSAPMPRKILTDLLEEKGWTVAGAVTKETILVVCDDPEGQSTKLKKARSAGIPVVTYDSFLAEEGIPAE